MKEKAHNCKFDIRLHTCKHDKDGFSLTMEERGLTNDRVCQVTKEETASANTHKTLAAIKSGSFKALYALSCGGAIKRLQPRLLPRLVDIYRDWLRRHSPTGEPGRTLLEQDEGILACFEGIAWISETPYSKSKYFRGQLEVMVPRIVLWASFLSEIVTRRRNRAVVKEASDRICVAFITLMKYIPKSDSSVFWRDLVPHFKVMAKLWLQEDEAESQSIVPTEGMLNFFCSNNEELYEEFWGSWANMSSPKVITEISLNRVRRTTKEFQLMHFEGNIKVLQQVVRLFSLAPKRDVFLDCNGVAVVTKVLLRLWALNTQINSERTNDVGWKTLRAESLALHALKDYFAWTTLPGALQQALRQVFFEFVMLSKLSRYPCNIELVRSIVSNTIPLYSLSLPVLIAAVNAWVELDINNLRRTLATCPLKEEKRMLEGLLAERTVIRALYKRGVRKEVIKCWNVPACNKMGSEAKFLSCGGCATDNYCSQHCQKAAWQSHKFVCPGRKEAPSVAPSDACCSTSVLGYTRKEIRFITELAAWDVERHIPGLQKILPHRFPHASFETASFVIVYSAVPPQLHISLLEDEIAHLDTERSSGCRIDGVAKSVHERVQAGDRRTTALMVFLGNGPILKNQVLPRVISIDRSETVLLMPEGASTRPGYDPLMKEGDQVEARYDIVDEVLRRVRQMAGVLPDGDVIKVLRPKMIFATVDELLEEERMGKCNWTLRPSFVSGK